MASYTDASPWGWYLPITLPTVVADLKKGLSAEEALEKSKGQYGRFDEGVKYIDPRHE